MRRPTVTAWTTPFGGIGRHRRRLPQAERILVPVGVTTMDEQAVLLAGEVARAAKGTLFLVYIIEVPRALPLDAPPEEELDRAEAILAEMEAFGERHRFRVVTELLQARQTGPAVVREVNERQVDLIIMGIGHQQRYGEFTLGEAVPHILEYAPCPVWVLREPISPDGQERP